MSEPDRQTSPAATLDDSQLHTALAHYRIGEITQIDPAHVGEGFISHVVHTTLQHHNREYVLAVADDTRPQTSAYVAAMDAFTRAGLPVAAVLRTREHEPWVRVGSQIALLHPFLDGHRVHNPTVKQVGALGRFLARVHLVATADQLSAPEQPCNPHWLGAKSAAVRSHVGYHNARLIDDSLRQVKALLARTDVAELPRGVVHSQLTRRAALFNQQGLTGVIGFQHLAGGTLLYDIATVCNDWCSDGDGMLDPTGL